MEKEETEPHHDNEEREKFENLTPSRIHVAIEGLSSSVLALTIPALFQNEEREKFENQVARTTSGTARGERENSETSTDKWRRATGIF